MTPIQPGIFLQSHSLSADDYFYQAVVCLVEYNSEGALGFVVNCPYQRSLNELSEFAHLPSFPLWQGGPVDHEHLYFIHHRPNLIQGGKKLKTGIYYGGNFTQATTAIERGIVSCNDIRIFIGYCGWNTGDLEEEIEAEGWSLVEKDLFE